MISRSTHEQNLAILHAHDLAGERERTHRHYLKGTVYCEFCGNRLCLNLAKGKGGEYLYFFCTNRRSGRCLSRHVAVEAIEELVAQHYAQERFDEKSLEGLQQALRTYLDDEAKRRLPRVHEAQDRIVKLDAQRRKLLELRYADLIPLDLFGEEQRRIAAEMAEARRAIEESFVEWNAISDALHEAIGMLRDPAGMYRDAPVLVRRQLNQMLYERIYVREDAEPRDEPTERLRLLREFKIAFAGHVGPGAPGSRARNAGRSFARVGLNKGLLADLRGVLSNQNICSPIERLHRLTADQRASLRPITDLIAAGPRRIVRLQGRPEPFEILRKVTSRGQCWVGGTPYYLGKRYGGGLITVRVEKDTLAFRLAGELVLRESVRR
jgi:hypothetical protein